MRHQLTFIAVLPKLCFKAVHVNAIVTQIVLQETTSSMASARTLIHCLTDLHPLSIFAQIVSNTATVWLISLRSVVRTPENVVVEKYERPER